MDFVHYHSNIWEEGKDPHSYERRSAGTTFYNLLHRCLGVEDSDASWLRPSCSLSIRHVMWAAGGILQRVNSHSQTSMEKGVQVDIAAGGCCIAHNCEDQLTLA